MLRQQTARKIVQNLWNYCSVLRDDGLSYPDYVEQLTYLLFLKMADERAIYTGNKEIGVPEGLNWSSLTNLSGSELHAHYNIVLQKLSLEKGALGSIFKGAENKILDPAKLDLLINELIDKQTWNNSDIDVKGEAYEGLLERNAQDSKSGAGQYFTPRPVIDAIIECIDPKVGETVLDPACGTGGFLISALRHIRSQPTDLNEKYSTKITSIQGIELVPEVARLATMNLLLHGVDTGPSGELPILIANSLEKPPAHSFNVVVTNPPFGKRSSITHVAAASVGDEGLKVARPDFWVSSSNKELNFIQHIVSALSPGGRAAVVVPEGVLSAGGAGTVIRRRLLTECFVHTLLRLPPGIFYAQGVNASVIFFDKPKSGEKVPNDGRLWVYDLRTNMNFNMGGNRITQSTLVDFVTSYKPGKECKRQPSWSVDDEAGRWRDFLISDILDTDEAALNITWSPISNKFDNVNRTSLDKLRDEIVGDLKEILQKMDNISNTS